MRLREKVSRAAQDPDTAYSLLALQHRKLLSENPFYKAFVRSYELPSAEAWCAHAGPLLGCSFGVKDNIAVAGQPLSFGLQPPALEAAPRSAAVVQQLIESGALLFGSTNLDELGLSHTGDNPHFGRPRNPLRDECSPLGSSGGSAVAVARGQVDFSLGTDFGGSVRLPAAACGLWGLKTTPGLLSAEGTLALSKTMDGLGLLIRDPDDAIFLLATLAPKLRARMPMSVIHTPPARMIEQMESESAQCFAEITRRLAENHTLRELPKDFSFIDMLETRKLVAVAHATRALTELGMSEQSMPDCGRALFRFLNEQKPARVHAAEAAAAEYTKQLDALLSGGALLLTPAIPCPTPTWDRIESGAEQEPPLNVFLAPANLCGLAALVMPTLLRERTPPFALQLVAARNSDMDLLVAAGRLHAELAIEY